MMDRFLLDATMLNTQSGYISFNRRNAGVYMIKLPNPSQLETNMRFCWASRTCLLQRYSLNPFCLKILSYIKVPSIPSHLRKLNRAVNIHFKLKFS